MAAETKEISWAQVRVICSTATGKKYLADCHITRQEVSHIWVPRYRLTYNIQQEQNYDENNVAATRSW